MAGKERSPNYPGIDLTDAIELTRSFYSKEGRTTVPAEVAFKAMGYKGASGSAKSHLGALKAYGLLDGSRGTVKLSERGLALMLLTPASAEYRKAIREAALEPPIFQELYGSKPEASDEALRHYLVLTRKFREDGANRLIRVYRATLALAELDKGDYAPTAQAPAVETQPEQPRLGDQVADRATGPVGQYLVKVPLAVGIRATVSIEAESGRTVRPVHLDRLAEHLRLAKLALESDDSIGDEAAE